MRHYILAGHEVVPCADIMAWAEWFGTAERHVANDQIKRPDADPVQVSTVFLGMDHRWSGDGPPLVFESLVFGGPLDGEMYRYSTWIDAERGHSHLLAQSITEGELAAWEVRAALDKIGTP